MNFSNLLGVRAGEAVRQRVATSIGQTRLTPLILELCVASAPAFC
jgi:hypothetical protein